MIKIKAVVKIATNDNEKTLKETIQEIISSVFVDKEYAFDAYILMKDTKKLKKFVMFEGTPNKRGKRNNKEKNFKMKIQDIIEKVIEEKFVCEVAEFDSVENIIDNQNKFYVIHQTDVYKPFAMIEEAVASEFKDEDRINAEGILFRYQRADTVIWAFQYFWSNAIPNRQKKAFCAITQDGDVYKELEESIIVIGHKVDLLIINNQIVTNNIGLLQAHYGFEQYVRSTAQQIVNEIAQLNFVSNIAKVNEYISREKLTSAKKMLRIKNSRVLTMDKQALFKRIEETPRWQGKFNLNEENQTIELKNYGQVEDLIDLLDERFTRSDVTGEEYDTRVKKWVPAQKAN